MTLTDLVWSMEEEGMGYIYMINNQNVFMVSLNAGSNPPGRN